DARRPQRDRPRFSAPPSRGGSLSPCGGGSGWGVGPHCGLCPRPRLSRGLARADAAVAGMLRERGYAAKTYVDHGWMLDRAAAARAGLGWLGKNTNLLVPGAGSYVLLAEIVTSAALQPDQPLKKTCGSCDAFLRICPTGALV